MAARLLLIHYGRRYATPAQPSASKDALVGS